MDAKVQIDDLDQSPNKLYPSLLKAWRQYEVGKLHYLQALQHRAEWEAEGQIDADQLFSWMGNEGEILEALTAQQDWVFDLLLSLDTEISQDRVILTPTETLQLKHFEVQAEQDAQLLGTVAETIEIEPSKILSAYQKGFDYGQSQEEIRHSEKPSHISIPLFLKKVQWAEFERGVKEGIAYAKRQRELDNIRDRLNDTKLRDRSSDVER